MTHASHDARPEMAEWVGSKITRDIVKKQVSTSHERTRPNKNRIAGRGVSHRQTQDSIMDSMKMTPRLGNDADADELVKMYSTGRCKSLSSSATCP